MLIKLLINTQWVSIKLLIDTQWVLIKSLISTRSNPELSSCTLRRCRLGYHSCLPGLSEWPWWLRSKANWLGGRLSSKSEESYLT